MNNNSQTFIYEGRWIKNWFSNRCPFDEPLIYQGITYLTPENLYQAMKTLDREERARIAAMPPKAAKQAAKHLKIRADWEQVKEAYMAAILAYKFAEGTTWHHKLMATGNEPIVEWNNWHDNYWGHCICDRCQGKPKQNRLGVLLMQIRENHKLVSAALPAKPPGSPLSDVMPNS